MNRVTLKLAANITSAKIVLQLVQLINSLLVISILPLAEYGVYAALITYTTIAGKVGLRGLDNAIVAVAGHRKSDGQLNSLTCDAVRVSGRFLLFTLPIVLVGFIVVLKDTSDLILIASSVGLAVLLCASMVLRKLFDAILVAEGKGGTAIKLQFFSELFRTPLLIGIFFLSGGLLLTAVSLFFIYLINFWQQIITVSNFSFAKSDESILHELQEQTRPLIPGIVFASVQGHIILVLGTFFLGISEVAQVAVASRLGFFFTFLNALAFYLVLPRFSHQSSFSTFSRQFVRWSVPYFLLTIFVSFGVYTCFDLLLFVVGEEYRVLQDVLWLVLGMHALNAISAFLWSVQAARKWIWAWMPYFSIPFTLLVQIVSLAFIDVGSINGVIYFGLISAVSGIVVRIFMFGCGLIAYQKVVT